MKTKGFRVLRRGALDAAEWKEAEGTQELHLAFLEGLNHSA